MDLTPLLDHDFSDDCRICRTQDVIQIALLPAAAAWELNNELPHFSVALHGAAELLGAMLMEGADRSDIEAALGRLLDDVEARIEEDQVMGGPPKGNA